MKLFYGILLTVFFLMNNSVAQAQQIALLAADTTGVIIHADPRLSLLTETIKAKSRNSGIRSGRGFRVQIYSGSDRSKANAVKVDFMRRFPNVRTYMSYIQPQFRVKAGDFKTREDARKLVQQLNHLYAPVMIVPDIIVINPFKE